MKKRLLGALAGAMALVATGTAGAVPLTLEYTVKNVGSGQYAYDFSLILDNNDGTWVAGQEWDWLVFGDAPFASPSPFTDFAFTHVDPAIDGTTFTHGGHNGPTIFFEPESVLLPGWQPLSIGDALYWSGTSSSLLGSGSLLWSALVVGDGAVVSSFVVASLTSIAVPEPSTLALFGVGLAWLGVLGSFGFEVKRPADEDLADADGGVKATS